MHDDRSPDDGPAEPFEADSGDRGDVLDAVAARATVWPADDERWWLLQLAIGLAGHAPEGALGETRRAVFELVDLVDRLIVDESQVEVAVVGQVLANAAAVRESVEEWLHDLAV